MTSPDAMTSSAFKADYLILQRILSILVMFFCTWIVLQFPIARFYVAGMLMIYAIVLFNRPFLCFFILPIVLPALDLAPWSGWYFFDESDLFVLATLGVFLFKFPMRSIDLSKSTKLIFYFLAVSYLLSALIGFFPLTRPDWNALSSYYSPYNSLRVFKGFFWVCCLLPFFHVFRPKLMLQTYLSGAVAGLGLVMAVAVWERSIFSGLLDLNARFRIVSTFSIMHIGSGAIEGYLALTLPLTYAWLSRNPRKYKYYVAALLGVLGIYVMVVTFSRAGVLALAAAFIVIAFLILFQNPVSRSNPLKWLFVLMIFALILGAVSWRSNFMQERLKDWRNGLKARSIHWEKAISLMEADRLSRFLGMGLGAFPRVFQSSPHIIETGSHRYITDGADIYLRLIGGPDFYFDQRLSLSEDMPYALSLDVRKHSNRGRLSVALCEKNLLYSFDCLSRGVATGENVGKWIRIKSILDPKGEINSQGYFGRPVALSFFNPEKGTVIDVDNISLTDSSGKELINNGDFQNGNSRWFFQGDHFWIWHIENIFVSIFFEQGFIGLAAFIAFSFTVFRTLVVALGREIDVDLYSGILAAFAGFYIVGCFSSLFDSPRLTMLFYLLCVLVLLERREAKGQRDVE